MSRRRVLWGGLLGLCALAAGVALAGLLLGPAAWRLGGTTVAGLSGRDRADAINNARQTLLAAAGGSAAVIGLGFTARTYYLSSGRALDRARHTATGSETIGQRRLPPTFKPL